MSVREGARWIAVAGLLSLCLYLGLPGQLYDGDALKQAIWNYNRPLIGVVNHPYSQAWFYAWWRWVSPVAGGDFDVRMRWLAALNGLLGSSGVALAVAILLRAGVRPLVSLATGLFLGATNAWFYHSTQATEPMMGEFWLLVAIWSADPRPLRPKLAGFCSGVAFGLSVAAYQSYLMAGPGLLWLWLTKRQVTWFGILAAATTGLGLFTLAAVLRGAHSVAEVVGYCLTKPDGDYWGFFRLGSLPQVPVGLAQAILPPWPTAGWPGLRQGFAALGGMQRLGLIGLVSLPLGYLAVALFPQVRSENRRLRTALLITFVFGCFPPFYLLPYYNKLWLLPLSAIVLAAGLGLAELKWGAWIALTGLTVVVARNTPKVFWFYATGENVPQRVSRALEAALKPDDFLVCDGWHHGLLFLTKHPNQSACRLISSATSKEAVTQQIETAVAQGRTIYFYQLLELSRADWAQTEIQRRHVSSFDDFDRWRRNSDLVWRGSERGVPGDLYRLRTQ